MHSISSMDYFITQTGVEIFKDCPYIKGNTKGIHIYLKEKHQLEYSDQLNVYINFDADFIKLNNMWENFGKEVYNYDKKRVIPLFDFDDIKHIFNINKLNIKNQVCDSITDSANKPKLSKKLNSLSNQKKPSQKIKNI